MGWTRVFELLLALALPTRCPGCGAAGPAPCPSCWSRLERAPVIPSPPGVDRVRALIRYDDTGRDLLVRMKYGNARSTVRWLAAGMATLANKPAAGFDAITWAPTTAERRRERGFDQAELLARAVARQLRRAGHRPHEHRSGGAHHHPRTPAVVPLLVRLPGPAQTGRTRRERQADPPRFEARARAPASILLVDDVFTTGATVGAAARALRSAGAQHVDVVTAACTPLKVCDPPADP
jgi:predicted amidophosphoribosyltransferase